MYYVHIRTYGWSFLREHHRLAATTQSTIGHPTLRVAPLLLLSMNFGCLHGRLFNEAYDLRTDILIGSEHHASRLYGFGIAL